MSIRNNPGKLEEIAKTQGLPVEHVEWHTKDGDRYIIVLKDGATPQQQIDADTLSSSFLAKVNTQEEYREEALLKIPVRRLIRLLINKGIITRAELLNL